MIMISFKDFQKLDLRVATIKDVKDHPNADKLFILKVDLGSDGERQIVAGIKGVYEIDELIGKQIVVASNLEPATIRGVESKGMLLAAEGEMEKPILIVPEKQTASNAKIR